MPTPENFTQVTKDTFFATIGPRDVHPRIINAKYPYTSAWECRYSRDIVGKTTHDSYYLDAHLLADGTQKEP